MAISKNTPEVKAKCASTNAAGKPCQNRAVLASGLCVVHDSDSAVASRFHAGDSHTVGPGAPSKFEVWRDQVLAEFDVWSAPYRDAVENAVVTTAYQGTVTVTDIADLDARMDAAEKVFDRLFGKSKQTTELTGANGGPIEVSEVPLDADRAAAVAAILKSTGAAG